MKFPGEIVKKIWRDRREGSFGLKHTIPPDAMEKGGVKRYKIIKDKKMFLLVDQSKVGATNAIVAFPKPEHIDAFNKTTKSWFMHEEYPGCVGILLLSHCSPSHGYSGPILIEKTYYTMPYCQTSFTTGQGHGQLPRSLATKYAGWRYRAITEAVDIVRKTSETLYIEREDAKRGNFMADLNKACTGLGLKPGNEKEKPSYWEGERKVVQVV
ncbi:MAG: hypothetical protein ABH854_01790 [Candidatus Diapherotrites archaeon]